MMPSSAIDSAVGLPVSTMHPQKLLSATKHIVLFGAGSRRTRLITMLENIGCCVHFGERGTGRLDHAIASVVSDEVDDCLDLCASLAGSRPVMLISDEYQLEFRIAAARAGVAALIRRPVNPIEVSEWLNYFAEQASSDPITVMIIDDDRLASEINAEILRSAGTVVRIINDPLLALQAIEGAAPDLILMDLRMPGVDGVELTQVIRQSRQFAALPIIFFSAERDEGRTLAARRLGGDDFISKPVAPLNLIALVRLRADRSKLLRSMIERDRLTGLYNQAAFQERLSQELERSRRTQTECSLVTIDVDFFKTVNDTHGHPMGDLVLRTLSAVLGSGLRRIDVVGRCGGEEFGILLLDTGREAATLVIDKLRMTFERLPFGPAKSRFFVTFSAGIASTHGNHRMSELLAAADGALYAAKRGGRNKVCTALPGTRFP